MSSWIRLLQLATNSLCSAASILKPREPISFFRAGALLKSEDMSDASALKRVSEDTTETNAAKRLRTTTDGENDEQKIIQTDGPQETQADEKEDNTGSGTASSKTPSRTRGEKSRKQFSRAAPSNSRRKRVGEEQAEGEEEQRERSNLPRYPKRQCALLIGFCGSGYNGMQIQSSDSGTRTIEGEIFSALVKAGAVSQDNADKATKVNLARAARTDAGVHAAGNVISLKMITSPPGVEDIVARINQELPPEIRMWGYARTQNSFNARTRCDSRKYTYFFPSYLLLPPKPESGLHRSISSLNADETTVSPDAFWANTAPSSSFDADLADKREWRVGKEQLARIREIAQKFEGSHNFHNFTVLREFSDPSSQRFIKQIEISEPAVYGKTEWLSVLFHGQSFMLHQRKMMSALVLSCRCNTPPKIIEELYGRPNVFIPKMPALGLLLEEPLFHSYNGKIAEVNEKLEPTDDQYRPPIGFDIHRDKMNAFKEQYIYKNMREIEDRDGIFDAWIRSIDAYAGTDFQYLGPSGIIPEISVIKKGEKREKRFREKKIFDTTSFPLDAKAKKQLEEDLSEEEDEEAHLNKKDLIEAEG